MAALSKIAQVQLQRRKIEDEISALRAAIAVKEERLNKLLIAEDVLNSLSGAKDEATEVEPEAPAAPSPEKPKWGEKRTPKPEGTPTVPQMILTVLRDAQTGTTRKGLEPKDIAAEIAKRWWPDVTINAVGPIAWRMHKREELSKRGSKYFPPKSDERAATPEPAPKSGSLFN